MCTSRCSNWFSQYVASAFTRWCPALIALAAAGPLRAATLTVPIETSDQVVLSDGTLRFVADTTARVGDGYSTTAAGDYVLPYKLPTLPAGERILSATLSLNLEGWVNTGTTLRNVDLYGIKAVSGTNAVSAGHYVDGTNPANTTFLLQDNLVTPADANSSSATGQTVSKTSADLGAFLQGQFDDGASAGQYGFLVLAHDTPLSLLRYYTFTAANSTTKPKPVLTITTGTASRGYYVDAGAGADSGSGSIYAPWKTINRAQLNLHAGDTLYCTGSLGKVYMNTGTSQAGVNPYVAGTASAPITYRAWPGRSQPRIDELIFDGVKRDTYLTFDGFLFNPGAVDYADYVSHAAVYLNGAWHTTLSHCDVVGAQVDVPLAVLPSNTNNRFTPYTPLSPTSPHSNPAISAGTPGNASFVTIDSCHIRNCGIGIMVTEPEAGTAPNPPLRQSRNWVIKNTDIQSAAEDGIRFAGADAGADSTVQDCTISEQNYCQSALVWRGYAYRNGAKDPTAFANKQWKRMKQIRTSGTTQVTQTALVYFTTTIDAADGYQMLYLLADDKTTFPLRNVNTYWEMFGTDTNGSTIQFRPREQDTVVSGSTVIGAPLNGDSTHTDCIAVMAQASRAVFERTKARISDWGGQALKIENIPYYGANRHPTDIVFRNNLFYSTGNPAIKSSILNIAGGHNAWFVHNTIFGGLNYNMDGAVRFVDTVEEGQGFQGVYFYNNIIAGGGVSSSETGQPLAESHYNVWLQPPYSKTTYSGTKYATSPGIVMDPVTDYALPLNITTTEASTFMSFANAATGDLHLQPGSLAGDRGLATTGTLTLPGGLPAKDMDNVTRNTPPDDGAYEIVP